MKIDFSMHLSSQWLSWSAWYLHIIKLWKSVGKLPKWCNSMRRPEIKPKKQNKMLKTKTWKAGDTIDIIRNKNVKVLKTENY